MDAATRADRLARIRERRDELDTTIEAATWFTAAELAARWGVSDSTVYEIPPKELPYRIIGRKQRRYAPSAVAAYEAPALPVPAHV